MKIKRFAQTVLALVLVSCIAFTASGCTTVLVRNKNAEVRQLSLTVGENGSDHEGLYISITDVEFCENISRLEVTWHNDTKYTVTYGANYTIEMEQDGEWVDRSISDVAWIEIAYVLEPGDKHSKTYDLSNRFDVSEPGKYRIKTECYVQNGQESSERCVLWAEFEILMQVTLAC